MITPTFTVDYIGSKIVVIDTTVYGGVNPARSAYNVAISIAYKPAHGADKLVSIAEYDPVSVTQVDARVGDGRYVVTVTHSGAEEVTTVIDSLIYDNLTACLEEKKNVFINSSCCQDGTSETFDEYQKVRLIHELIVEIETSGIGYNKAQCLLEYGFTFCRTANCLCGC